MLLDYTYFIYVVPFLLLSLWAQMKVQTTFSKYSKLSNRRNLTGADAARRILDMNGLTSVRVERVSGNLTDHFDPKTNCIRLSETVHDSNSVAAVGVAAHEAGHAVQHANQYMPIVVRNAIVPVVNIGSRISLPLLFLGLILDHLALVWVGIILFGLAVVFQTVTLPVEFNASRRAIQVLGDGYLAEDELKGVKKVLSAAAMTYVAAALTSAAQLLRYIVLFTGNGRRRD